MNPLDFHGPEFLLFYLVLATVTVYVAVSSQRQRESQSLSGRTHLTDPYLIAYLRGGPNEALRVATVSLLDRGLLTASGTRLQPPSPDAADSVGSALEKAILSRFAKGREAADIFRDGALQHATVDLRTALEQRQLLPDAAAREQRAVRALVAVGFLGAVALIKIVVALSRGRQNIGFLVLLAGVAVLATLKLLFPRRTPLGDEALDGLRALFSGVRWHGRRDFSETALIAAVFGLGYLPASHQARQLYARATHSSSVDSGSGCGTSSSCGSSCGSSGGSSCGGGGGCGGGGCGGCGS